MPPRKAHNCIGCGTVEPTNFAKTMKSKCKRCSRFAGKTVSITRQTINTGQTSHLLTADNLSHYQYYQLHGRFPESVPTTHEQPTTLEQASVCPDDVSDLEDVREDRDRVTRDLMWAAEQLNNLREKFDELQLANKHLTEERDFYMDRCKSILS